MRACRVAYFRRAGVAPRGALPDLRVRASAAGGATRVALLGSTARLRFQGGGVASRAACASSVAAGWWARGWGHLAACEQAVHVRWGRKGGEQCAGGEGAGGRERRRRARSGAVTRGRDRYAAAERAGAVQRSAHGSGESAQAAAWALLTGPAGTRAACDGRLLTELQNAPRVR